uniref:Uncharacterized protein n=1 Tax=Macaca mulatta TaxID=9544 RepID=A0A5F7Z950_MACMU
MTHCSLDLLASNDLPSTASQLAGTTGTCHHIWLIFVIFIETGFCHVVQAGLELLGSSDSPISASQSAGSHLTLSVSFFLFLFFFFSIETGSHYDARLVLNSWPQAILLPWSPKVLGLQA